MAKLFDLAKIGDESFFKIFFFCKLFLQDEYVVKNERYELENIPINGS